MKRKHFWQRVYTATLALFLLCLYGGSATIAWVGYRESLNAQTELVRTEQQSLALDLTRNIEQYGNDYRWALELLYASYAEESLERGAYIEVQRGGEVSYSNLPDGFLPADAAPVEVGIQRTENLRHGGRLFLCITQGLGGEDGEEYQLVYAKDITAFADNWRGTVLVYAGICALVSVLLAVVLVLLLRRLSRPLEELNETADRFATGEFAVRMQPAREADEIGSLSESFNNMADSIQKNIRQLEDNALQKQQLVDNLSHEIRTPLTAIQGYAEYLQSAPLTPEESAEVTVRILRESGHLNRIATHMLEFTSLRPETMLKEPVPLADLLTRVATGLEPKAKGEGVEISVRGPKKPVVLQGDSALLESLLLNLSENAIKACDEGGKVKLRAENTKHGCTVTVQDDGCGMTEDELAHMGEMFWRADKARARRKGGAGLGVALCQRIAQLHGASLHFTSSPGLGTTAVVEFPLLKGGVDP